MFVDGIDEKCVDQNESAHGNVQNREGIQKKEDISVLRRNIKRKLNFIAKLQSTKNPAPPPPPPDI